MNGDAIRELREIADRWNLNWADPPAWFALEAKTRLLNILGDALIDAELNAINYPQICADIRALRRILKAVGPEREVFCYRCGGVRGVTEVVCTAMYARNGAHSWVAFVD